MPELSNNKGLLGGYFKVNNENREDRLKERTQDMGVLQCRV